MLLVVCVLLYICRVVRGVCFEEDARRDTIAAAPARVSPEGMSPRDERRRSCLRVSASLIKMRRKSTNPIVIHSHNRSIDDPLGHYFRMGRYCCEFE